MFPLDATGTGRWLGVRDERECTVFPIIPGAPRPPTSMAGRGALTSVFPLGATGEEGTQIDSCGGRLCTIFVDLPGASGLSTSM